MEVDVLLLAIHHMSFLKNREKLLIWETIESISNFGELSSIDIEEIVLRKLKKVQWDPHFLIEKARQEALYLTKQKIFYTFYWSKDYPVQLREIYDPPFVLYYRGTLPNQDKPLVGVVGTRHPTGKGKTAAYRVGFELGEESFSVVSGLARGIDTNSHKGNLDGGGNTVAVLGSGIDEIYPKENKTLARNIIENGGCMLSEYSPGSTPEKFHFPERNRIISGLARAVVIIEAPERSGALITADYALEQGRELYVHRVGTESAAGKGTKALEQDGAPVISNGNQILTNLGIKKRMKQRDDNDRISPEEGLEEEAFAGRYLAELLRRELNGSMVKHNGVYYRRQENG